ncbi:DnaD domain protein [Shouchella shacheensis]|uniref:DnaD domain protein n=1 Tax=Shouchella shacheensis TaxID=1649580 RepID=UPI0007404F74|nr:DnaD domain protein [Shouchella shacheensis]
MNYIAELNAFHTRQETNPLTPKAKVLWSVLMDVCNRTGWKQPFTVAVSVLSVKTGLTEDQVFKARREMVKHKYITVHSRPGKAAAYEIHSLRIDYAVTPPDNASEATALKSNEPSDLSPKNPHLDLPHDETNDPLHEDSHGDVQGEAHDQLQGDVHGDPHALVKKEKTIPDHTKAEEELLKEVLHFCQEQGFETPTTRVKNAMQKWCTDSAFEAPNEVVIEAIRRSVARGVPQWQYAASLLLDWKEKRLTRLADIHFADPNRSLFHRETRKVNRDWGDEFRIPDDRLGF